MKIIAATIIVMCLALSGAAWAQEAGGGWLGVELQNITKEEADSLGWAGPRGVKLLSVAEGGPAHRAGLQPGDVLLSLDGVEIENVKAFMAAVSKKAAGTDIRLAISRAGWEKRLAVKLGARETIIPKQSGTRAVPADNAPPPNAPIPMLDTGGHMALISDIAFTPDGRQIVSAGDDKVIRVWDVETGKTVRTLLGEAAAGEAGKIYAMALSPDGKWAAVGGWMDKSSASVPYCGDIRLYDFASGRLVALLKGHENVVFGLAFSPDGRRLISGSADNTAIIWDVAPNAAFGGRNQSDALRARSANIAPVIAAALHRLRGHSDAIYAVGFTPDGARAVTGSDDHDLRLWSVESGAPLQTMSGHKDEVYALAMAPDGTIASGDWSGEVRLWNGKTGASLKVLARQKTMVGSLSFSPDGKRLLSGVGSHPLECHVYDTASGRETVTYRGHDNIVLATAICPDGRWAATGGGNGQEIHIWDLATAERRKGPEGQPLTLSGRGQPVWAVGFSTDGQRIGWGHTLDYDSPDPESSRGPLEYALTLPTGDAPLTGPVSIGEGAFLRAVAEQNGWSLQHRKGGSYGRDAILDIKQDGRVVKSIERGSTDGYAHRAYTFTPDGQTIISGGGNGVLTAYDRAGTKIGEFTGHEGDVWAVAASPDGKYLVSSADDQTVRLWNLNTRELLVTLYRGTDGEWVMWTPEGYYASSPAGAELIGWQINHGPENAADYVTGSQLRGHLHRPDVVARTIQLASEADALRELNVHGFKLENLLANPAPRFSISSPAEGATVRNGAAEIQLALEATPDLIKQINIRVNGRQIAAVNPGVGGAFEPGTLTVNAELAQGRNEVSITAVNDIGEQTHTLTLNHEGEGDLDKRGTLYILAIGVDEYPGLKGTCAGLPGAAGSCDLRFAGADASAFADMAARRMTPLHERTVRRVLTNRTGADQPPTRTNIVDALGMLQQAQPNDTVVVFLAGHGKSDGLNYRFLPTDSVADGVQIRQSSVVSWFEIKEALEGARGRRILFLDTCHAGNAYNQRLDSDVYNADIVTYAAAQGDQRAQEDAASGHGLFTAAVVDGIDGAADGDKDKRVLTNELGGFVKERVRSLATALGHRQEPRMYRGKDAGDYLLSHAE